MNRNRIASSLCTLTKNECVERITPPWADTQPVVKAYWDVQTVIRQRDELLTIFPNKSPELHRQCVDLIMDIASDLHEQLYEDLS